MPELSHTVVSARDARPERIVLVLHGILGSRSNWRSLARQLVAERPEWAACLVDLRMHGESQGFLPPHSVDAAAADLDALVDDLALPVDAVLGHSFGGKVALAYAREHRGLASLVTVDSMPGPRPGGRGSEDTLAVVAMLRALPSSWASRDAFVAAVVAEGRSVTLARWLAMNLAPSVADSFTLRLDLDAISALLDDYFAVDLWPVLSEPPEDARVSIVVGGASTIFDDEDLARAHAIAEAREGTTLEVIEGAGHWVHVDAPDALIVAWSAALP